MSYYWPSIVQLVTFGLVAIIAVIQSIFGIILIVGGWWAGIGAIIHGIITIGYCIFVFVHRWVRVNFSFVSHKRSHVALMSTKMEIILTAILCVTGLFIGIFCGFVGIGTFVLLLGWAIFEGVYVGTRKISDKWNMTLYDVAEVDVTGGAAKNIQNVQHPNPQQFQQFA
ncbi:hypothetical protein CspHIS471_0400850 [Cutaneotrichosporon sp. HIS471]|nr:hypothetical protein CspHIS471_0400850 [Cutaneotrichosporon sp. HIS471]